MKTIFTELTIDPEFAALIPPLEWEEREQLEKNILADGCRDPLTVWAIPPDESIYEDCKLSDVQLSDERIIEHEERYGCECQIVGRVGKFAYVRTRNKHDEYLEDWLYEWKVAVESEDDGLEGDSGEQILIDGHNRYEICERHGIPFETVPMVFQNRDQAALWIIQNQFGRRNLTPIDKVPLAERKREILEKQAKERQGTRTDIVANLPQCEVTKTRDKLAADVGVSGRTYDALRQVTEHGTPELVQAVRDKRLGAATAAEVAKLPEDEQREIASKETRAEAVAEAKKHVHVAQNSGNNEWYTPADYVAAARSTMGGIDLDPASSPKANETVAAKKIYTAADDGRAMEWAGRVWMNPPYAQPLIADFCDKLAECFDGGDVSEACVLVNNATETSWFHRLLSLASALCLPRGRVRFLDPNGKPGAPLQGQAVIYLGNNPQAFCDNFGGFGACLTK